MKHPKDHYRNLDLPSEYVWGGFDCDTNMHMFARKVLQSWQPVEGEPGLSRLVTDNENGQWRGVWENVLATESDLEDGNAMWMMERGYTRIGL